MRYVYGGIFVGYKCLFEILSFLAGKNVRRDEYDFSSIRNGECYISKAKKETDMDLTSYSKRYDRQ